MYLAIKTKYSDSGRLDFWAPDAGGYVRIITAKTPGTLGRQICHGGDFRGSTVWAQDEDEFKKEVRAWMADLRRWTKKMEVVR